jgi:hypothetical protein
MRLMPRCLSRFTDERMELGVVEDRLEDGVNDVLLLLGVDMLDVCAVRYASTSEDRDPKGC